MRPMSDPISSPIALGFLLFWLALCLWIAIDPEASLDIIFFLSRPVRGKKVKVLQVMSAFNAAGVACMLVIHAFYSLVR
jgi:hypothetical protein